MNFDSTITKQQANFNSNINAINFYNHKDEPRPAKGHPIRCAILSLPSPQAVHKTALDKNLTDNLDWPYSSN